MLRTMGLLSGTSADGIDAAVCEVEGEPPHLSARVLRARTVPYDATLRERILKAMRPGAVGANVVCALNFAVGEAFAQAAAQVLGDDLHVDLIGSHGQTLWHQVEADGRVSATLQIGEASVIAERTGITTVSNFRARDVAAGGQGAPLASYLDWLLLRHPTQWRAVQNIGGIGNVTFLPPLSHPNPRLVAFDTGPGNALIDAAMTMLTDGRLHFDANGDLAARGQPDREWLNKLLAHPYYRLPPPKTTGRELFGSDYAEELVRTGQARGLREADIVSTLTALTAETMAQAYHAYAPAPPDTCVVSGGGRHNQTLMKMLQAGIGTTQVAASDDYGIDGDFKEALLFAVLTYETWHNRPGCLPEQTGARHASVLGHITPGHNYRGLLKVVTS